MGLMPALHSRIASVCAVGAIEKVYDMWRSGALDIPVPVLIEETLHFLQRGLGLIEPESS